MDRRNLRVRKVSEKLAVVDEDERKRVSFLCLCFRMVLLVSCTSGHTVQWETHIRQCRWMFEHYLKLIISVEYT